MSQNRAVGWALVWALGCSGCWAPDLPEQSSDPVAAPRLAAVEPARDAQGVSSVARFTFELPASFAARDLRLYQGTLSEYHEQRVAAGEPPGTLGQREVPIVRWARADSRPDAAISMTRLVALARAPLAPGGIYSWALLSYGTLVTFEVSPQPEALLARYWPAPGRSFAGYAAYCADTALDDLESDVSFEPGVLVHLEPGLGLGDIGVGRCFHLQLPQADVPPLLVPPVELGGLTVHPDPLELGVAEPSVVRECRPPLQPLGPGCVRSLDDRLVVYPPGGASLWLFSGEQVAQAHAVDQGAAFVVRGLIPGTQQSLHFKALMQGGARYAGQVMVDTLPAQAHLVINEVLANALGPEPASEWIELYNDGSTTLDLSAFRLTDSAGEVALPAAEIHAGAYLLLASEDYPVGGPDVAFAADAQVVQMPVLSGGGLSNAGEELTLIDAAGETVSRFPALAAGAPGVSLARRSPDAPDDDEHSFHQHASPGASPGAANQLNDQ